MAGGSGFSDPRRRNNKDTLGSEFSHSNEGESPGRLLGLGEWTEASLQHRPLPSLPRAPKHSEIWTPNSMGLSVLIKFNVFSFRGRNRS